MTKYTATLTMGEETIVNKGDSSQEALDFGLDYTKVKLKGTVSLEKGKKKSSKFYHVGQLRRMFSNKLYRALESRNLERLLE